MIEKIVRDYLVTKLNPVTVVLEENNPPAKFVLIENTGGSEKNLVRSARIAIQSYAASMYEAAQLSESVETAMRDIVTLTTVSGCRINTTSYNFTDTTSKRYRYQAVFDIYY